MLNTLRKMDTTASKTPRIAQVLADGERLRVLLVTATDIDERLITGEIERSRWKDTVQLDRARTLAEAEVTLAKPYHLLMLDLTMPESAGALSVARIRALSPKTAIVVLCRFESDPIVAQCLRAGAQEFLMKGLYLAEPMMAVFGHAMESARLAGIYDGKDTLMIYETLSRDPQTGLASRHILRDIGRYASAVALRSGGQLALCFVQVDGLIDDRNDTTAKEIASILEQGTRATDAKARLGAEQFAVLLGPQITHSEVDRVMHRLIERIRALPREPGVQVPIVVSAGVAQLPRHCDNYEQLLANASLCSLTARATGTGKIMFYNLSQRGGTTRAL